MVAVAGGPTPISPNRPRRSRRRPPAVLPGDGDERSSSTEVDECSSGRGARAADARSRRSRGPDRPRPPRRRPPPPRRRSGRAGWSRSAPSARGPAGLRLHSEAFAEARSAGFRRGLPRCRRRRSAAAAWPRRPDSRRCGATAVLQLRRAHVGHRRVHGLLVGADLGVVLVDRRLRGGHLLLGRARGGAAGDGVVERRVRVRECLRVGGAVSPCGRRRTPPWPPVPR